MQRILLIITLVAVSGCVGESPDRRLHIPYCIPGTFGHYETTIGDLDDPTPEEVITELASMNWSNISISEPKYHLTKIGAECL